MEASVPAPHQIRFADQADKEAQIPKFKARFNPELRHSQFEKSLHKLQRSIKNAQDLCGLLAMDVDAAEHEMIVRAITQHVMDRFPRAKWKSTTWCPGKGLQVSFMPDSGDESSMKMEIVPMDSRDAKRSKLMTRFREVYYEAHERLGALGSCATNAELSASAQHVTCSGDDGVCVVCQEKLGAGDTATQLTACGHIFHTECIEGWLLGCKRECPVCKVPLSTTGGTTCLPCHDSEEDQGDESGGAAQDVEEFMSDDDDDDENQMDEELAAAIALSMEQDASMEDEGSVDELCGEHADMR